MSITIGRSTRVGAVVVALALSASAVAACSPAATEDTDATVLTHLEPQTFTTLYPPAAGFYPNGVIVNNITDRLLHQDPDTLELHPWIATDLPEVNGDSTVFTFDIRTDVTYSDGSPLTAENVVRNFDLYGLGDSDRLLTVSEQITNYERGEVIDEDTVRFHFSEPAPGFAQATSSFNAGLLADASLDLTQEASAPATPRRSSAPAPSSSPMRRSAPSSSSRPVTTTSGPRPATNTRDRPVSTESTSPSPARNPSGSAR